MTCNIHRNLFILKDFCLLPKTPTDVHYRNLFIAPWKAATSREEYGSFLQRWFRMSCSEVYPIPIPHFSSSLLSSPCWHHWLLTLRETCPNHCSSTQSQLFHLSYSSPAPSSLQCTIPPWVSQQPPTLFPTHFVCPQRHVSLPPSLSPLVFFF